MPKARATRNLYLIDEPTVLYFLAGADKDTTDKEMVLDFSGV